jgi:integrase
MRLMIPVSRKGRGQKSRTHTAVPVALDIVELLRSAVQGRNGAEPLLLRPHWRQIKPTSWELVGRGRWMASSELNRPWQKILLEAGVPATTVPYALRHSSIVRAITAGLPLRQVAGLHDTSTTMIERHYSAFVVDALDELARRAVVPLLPSDEGSDQVVALRG